MRQRLRRGGFPPEAIEAALSQLRAHRLVDDAEFAQYWVEQRQTFRPRGARLLRAELAQLGVARPVADSASRGAQGSAAEDAYRAADRRARQLAPLGHERFEVRLGQFLARRGFDWQTIADVVARLWADHHPA